MTASRVLGVAVVLAVASVAVQRVGPRVTVSGEGFCGADAVAPCTVATLGGGWPVAFLVDDPQISVPNRLSVAEDDVRPWALVLDVAFYGGLAWAVGKRAWGRGRNPQRASRGTSGSPPLPP